MGKQKLIQNLKIAVVGGSKSTLACLKTLRKKKFKNLKVFYYIPSLQKNLVEYCNLKKEFIYENCEFYRFTNIKNIEKILIKNKFDVLICIGLSQLLSQKIIESTKHGCIGMHPTNLPEGKGRSSIAWNIILKKKYRITIFKLNKDIDDGQVLVKSKFGPRNLDANSYYKRVYKDLEKLIIPSINKLIFKKNLRTTKKKNGVKEFYSLRKYEDGFLNFLDSRSSLINLIKATSSPHPGSYVSFEKKKYKVSLLMDEKNDIKYYAEPGTILNKKDRFKYLVMTKDYPIWLKVSGNFKIGQRFLVLNVYTLYKLLKK